MQSNYGVRAPWLQWKKQKLLGVWKESRSPNEGGGEAGRIVLWWGSLPKWRRNWEGLAAQMGSSIRGYVIFLTEGKAVKFEDRNGLFSSLKPNFKKVTLDLLWFFTIFAVSRIIYPWCCSVIFGVGFPATLWLTLHVPSYVHIYMDLCGHFGLSQILAWLLSLSFVVVSTTLAVWALRLNILSSPVLISKKQEHPLAVKVCAFLCKWHWNGLIEPWLLL